MCGFIIKISKSVYLNSLIKGAFEAVEPKTEQFFSKKIEYPFRRAVQIGALFFIDINFSEVQPLGPHEVGPLQKDYLFSFYFNGS